MTDHLQNPDNAKIRLLPLGGIGDVTKNMYIYEFRNNQGDISDILIVDCGIGFPDEEMYGIDLVIPDITYLLDKIDKIRGIILTHGHEDHIGALPYIIPKISAPVYATRLTAAFAERKLKEAGAAAKIFQVNPDDILKLGPFTIHFIRVTHSIPDAANLVIDTPLGSIYHGSDFKFDWTPLDGKQTDVQKIAALSKRGVLCLLSDCVRVEKEGYTLSERAIEDSLEKEIKNCPGKFIFTTQSSNISRIQQAISVSIRHNRKIAFLGRSIQQNVDIARMLGYLEFPDIMTIGEKDLKKYPPKDLSLIVTGSQAQPNSALYRIAEGVHNFTALAGGDTVVFSADPIPGYENAVHNLIDQLTIMGARVVYSEVTDDLHVSGHGASNDLALMISLTRAKYLLPIGGTFRQMKRYKELAMNMGYPEGNIILPDDGDIIEFHANKEASIAGHIDLRNIMVDGLGIGDIGHVVLRDRQTMANEGFVVAIVPVEQNSGRITREPDIISRGFIYMKESEKLIRDARKVVRQALSPKKGRVFDWQYLKKQVEDRLEKFLYKETHRRPLVLTVIIKV